MFLQNKLRKEGGGIYKYITPIFFTMDHDENGLFLCDKCKGEGKFLGTGKKLDENTYMAVFKICDKCGGDGKLDWVSMAIGKKKNAFPYEYELRKLLNEDLDFDDCFEKEMANGSISR